MKALQRSHRKKAEDVCVALSYLKGTHEMVYWLFRCVLKFRYLENVHELRIKN
jgi:hypothetical protein